MTKVTKSPLVLLLLAAAGLAAPLAPTTDASPPPPRPDRQVVDKDFKADRFSGVLDKHFAAWDHDRKGLTTKIVESLVRDTKVTDTAAAAVAALHIYQGEHKDKSVTINRELIENLVKQETAGKIDGPMKNVRDNYLAFLKHIRTVPRKVFTEDRISLKDLEQGQLGDCFLVATVGAYVHHNPDAVKKMFHVKADGSCEITFHDGRKVNVSKLTDAEIALGSSAGMQGLWMNYLEKGIGELWGKNKVATDNVGKGGDADKVIGLLTGHKGEYLQFRKDKAPPPSEAEAKTLMTKAHGVLDMVQEKHRVAVAGTPNGKCPPGISDDHDYAILGFDGKKNEVHLWNPWGNTFEPKGAPGLQNGYPVKGGEFMMPLKDFVHVFEGIYYESNEAAKKK